MVDNVQLMGDFQVSKGVLSVQKRGEYYDHDRTITKAGPIDPVNPASDVYNREKVHEDIGQNAEFIQIINRGTDDIFVRYCSAGTMNFQDETKIPPKDTKLYLNVYELRVRSPTIDNPYTVTEFLMWRIN